MAYILFVAYYLTLCTSAESSALHRLPAQDPLLGGSNWSSKPLRDATSLKVPYQQQRRDDARYVFMHHIVGNTYDYTVDSWKNDIQHMSSGGVDAIALNIGSESWQTSQLRNAYTAASQSGTNVKLFLSVDFTAFPCDVDTVVNVVNQFVDDASQFRVQGRPLVSSYSGECLGNAAWQQIKDRTGSYLMPFIPGLEGQFGNWNSLDSWLCWGCAWPQGDTEKSSLDDEYYLGQLGSIKFATSVSPWMFAHYGYKNFYQRGDDWLIANRWEKIVELRGRISMVEMLTWNDFGESDYFGEVKGALPQGTTWADGFSHLPFFELSKYYIAAYKTGSYPAINEDVIYYWARPHPAQAAASADALARPSGYNYAEDNLWALVLAMQPGTVTLTCGGSTETFSVQSGVNKLKIPLSPGKITVSMSRNGRTFINQTASNFSYNSDPRLYNYNVYAGTARTNPDEQNPAYPSLTTTSLVSPPHSLTTTSLVSPIHSLTITSLVSPPHSLTTTPLVSPPHSSTTTPLVSPPYSLTATSVVSPSPSVHVPDASWVYEGCFPDYSPRTLPGLFTRDEAQSLNKCIATCIAAGFTTAGVEYGVECFCADGIRQGIERVGEEECNMACAGAANETCGGGNRISVYSLYSATSSSPPKTTLASTTTNPLASLSATHTTGVRTTPVPKPSAVLVYYGCVEEGTTGSRRALTGARLSSTDMTPKMCQDFCVGYVFAGLESGQECYCGNTLTNNGATGATTSSSRCSMPCAGNSSTKCGGERSLSVYLAPGAPQTSQTVCSLGLSMTTLLFTYLVYIILLYEGLPMIDIV